jgi:hypothetical protein
MADDQALKYLKTYQKTKIDVTGWASEGGPSRRVMNPITWWERQREEEDEALRKEEESVATRLQNEARLLANVESLQQELIERQQAIFGYQQSIRRNVVSLSEYQSVLHQRKVAVGDGRLLDVGAALKGGWVPSMPEHKGENQDTELPEEASVPAKAEVDVGRSVDQKKGKTPGRGGMITWAELLARPTNEAFGDMVQKFKSTLHTRRVVNPGHGDERQSVCMGVC